MTAGSLAAVGVALVALGVLQAGKPRPDGRVRGWRFSVVYVTAGAAAIIIAYRGAG